MKPFIPKLPLNTRSRWSAFNFANIVTLYEILFMIQLGQAVDIDRHLCSIVSEKDICFLTSSTFDDDDDDYDDGGDDDDLIHLFHHSSFFIPAFSLRNNKTRILPPPRLLLSAPYDSDRACKITVKFGFKNTLQTRVYSRYDSCSTIDDTSANQ